MPSKRDLTLAGILPQLVRDSHGWHIVHADVTLRSAFQPVVSITHKRVVGYEALLRATLADGQPIAPDQLFARAKATGPALALERLTRCVHFANFAEQGVEAGWLFINALPQLLRVEPNHRAFTDDLCDHFGIPHHRVVVEMIEQPSTDEPSFDRAIEALRERDFLIAIDDFGTGFSNFDRIWRMRPDIVKLDRSLVARIATPNADHQFATQLVTMLHRAGTMVLGEGVETEDELMTLMEADADFVQGYWLGRPHASVAAASRDAPVRIESMWKRFHARSESLPGVPVEIASVEETVLAGARTYRLTDDLARAAQRAFRNPWARRVFVVDRHGDQREPSIASGPEAQSARLAPLFPDTESNWSRRAYFKRALAAPGRVALMGPHYSLTDGKDCYTAAVTIERGGGELEVFCVDFVASVPMPSSGGQ